MRLTRRGFVASGAAFWAFRAGAASADTLVLKGPAFGASWQVRLPAAADPAPVIEALTSVVASVDKAMSPFRATSEISKLNRTLTADWLPLAPATFATIAEAKRIHALTAGAFDPTLGGIVGRYGFGPITTAPAGAFADVALSENGLRKAHPAQTLDLCGIAKGHALDRIVTAIATLGHRDFLVELGGEVAARGLHPSGRAWQAGVERPLPGPPAIQRRVRLSGEALATSGDLINSYTLAQHRYSHIITPAHRPADTALASVSVFAATAITADALATALFALGPDEGAALAERQAIPALFVLRQGTGLSEISTAGFATRLIS